MKRTIFWVSRGRVGGHAGYLNIKKHCTDKLKSNIYKSILHKPKSFISVMNDIEKKLLV